MRDGLYEITPTRGASSEVVRSLPLVGLPIPISLVRALTKEEFGHFRYLLGVMSPSSPEGVKTLLLSALRQGDRHRSFLSGSGLSSYPRKD